MTMSPGNEPATSPAEQTASGEEQLRQEIEQERQQLGETVEALAAKADVKARAQAWAAGMADRVKADPARQRQVAVAAAAAAAVVFSYLAIRLWRA
jgi:Protein of unknown function (DUF3618)